MKRIREKKYWDIYHNLELNILELYWKKSKKDIEEEEFKNYLFDLVEIIKKTQVNGFLVDARAYHLVMSVEFQGWHDEMIIPLYIQNDIKDVVFIFKEEALIEFLSVEQTFEEEKAEVINTRFTDDLEKARAFFGSE